MSTYENPKYYGITQDYTAFNKAFMGAFDRYMSLYMQIEKMKKEEKVEQNNFDSYYKKLENLDEVPATLNNLHTEIYGLDGEIRKFLPGANQEQKRNIEISIDQASSGYALMNKYFSNPELFKELDIQTRAILDGIATGNTTVNSLKDGKNPWGVINFTNDNFDSLNIADLGKRLMVAERDFSNENFGRQSINSSVNKVQNQLENWQDENQQNIGGYKQYELIKNYADNLKIGENWAGYWHNEMEAEDKIVDLSDDAYKDYKDAWLALKKKYQGTSIMDNNKLDLSMFGFSMADFGEDNKAIKSLRDAVIKKHVADDLNNQVSPEFWSPAGDNITVREQKAASFKNIESQITTLQQSYINLNPDSANAAGFLSYIKNNPRFTATGKFQNFQIQSMVLDKYLTGQQGAKKAQTYFVNFHARTDYGQDYDTLRDSQKTKIDAKVKESMKVYEENARLNKVLNTNNGVYTDFRNFAANLINEIYNNDDTGETLISSNVYDVDGTKPALPGS